jgi:hypothetical protein
MTDDTETDGIDVSRRGLLAGGGSLVAGSLAGGALTGVAGVAAGQTSPPPEAYQPDASKNWWYFNGHLYDATPPYEPLYDYSAAIVIDANATGPVFLFTLVEYGADGRRIALSTEGAATASTENYEATFSSPAATGSVVQTRDGGDDGSVGTSGPTEWTVDLDPGGGVSLDLDYSSGYAPKLRANYPEGTGTANVYFWNQAGIDGTVGVDGTARPVVGVGFLEHVWGTWSRVSQRGIDFINVHLDDPDRATGDGGSGSDGSGSGALGAGDAGGADGRPRTVESLPRGSSVYFRRTFYQATPDGEPLREDVGPVLYFSRDGRRWLDATAIECAYTEADGSVVPCSAHRSGVPRAVDVRATLEDGSRLALRLDAVPDATISIPEFGQAIGRVHEGAATAAGVLTAPDGSERRVTGVAQTEHQRFGPFYPGGEGSCGPGPGDVTGNGRAATDPDGDCEYEDVDGDRRGERGFDAVDVQALFAHRDDRAIRGHPAAFDFNDDGAVDVVDVQKLFVETTR